MKVVWNQGPSVAARLTLPDNPSQPIQEIITVPGVAKNLPALQATRDDVVKRPRRIYSGLAWHNSAYLAYPASCVNVKCKGRPLFYPWQQRPLPGPPEKFFLVTNLTQARHASKPGTENPKETTRFRGTVETSALTQKGIRNSSKYFTTPLSFQLFVMPRLLYGPAQIAVE